MQGIFVERAWAIAVTVGIEHIFKLMKSMHICIVLIICNMGVLTILDKALRSQPVATSSKNVDEEKANFSVDSGSER